MNKLITEVPISELRPLEYNAKKHTKDQMDQLKQSITRFGMVDPIICNSAEGRKNIIIGGHFRVEAAIELGHVTIPVIYVDIADLEKEKELNIRLHKNQGEFDLELLAQFDESLLGEIGFNSEELDEIFNAHEETEEMFDLQKELNKLDIKNITIQKGDIYEIDGSRLCCGDSTIEADVLHLFGDERADMTLTDPPYILDYLKNGTDVTGFGAKKNRRYLETDVLPDDFTELWMTNISKIQKDHFSIIVYENWKNIRTIWGEMEKFWKVKNMIVWHLPNRNQGYAGKHKLFSKHDIAMVGSSEEQTELNLEPEEGILQNEYETALYAISGSPHWESYGKGKMYCPTDFIDHKSADEKSSGQAIIFGTKPIEILIPYIKIMTKRGDLIHEPFGGSGSTLIASVKMNRRCYLMEKSPVYAEVIKRRWEMATGKKAVKINEN
jgi:DNA modification methylase